MDGVEVSYFRTSRILRRIYFSTEMNIALRDKVQTFDLLHLHAVYLWPIRAAARAAVVAGVPYVMAPRGMLVKELIARKSAWIKRGWIAGVERRNLESASAIHATSAIETEELRR